MQFSHYTNLYKLNKTLKFRLIPQGETLQNLEKNKVMESDEKRADDYKNVKEMMDIYHKEYIDSCLCKCVMPVEKIEEYIFNDMKNNKKETYKKEQEKLLEELRKELAKSFAGYKKTLKPSSLIKKSLSDEKVMIEKESIERFSNFSTYFEGFRINRENLYSSEKKSTAIAYRLINQNLPKFSSNIRAWEKFNEAFDKSMVKKINDEFSLVTKFEINSFFEPGGFNNVLTQDGIDKYNFILGGYSKDELTKIKGLNELVNEYNQKNKDKKIMYFQPLYKQLLSEKASFSYIPEKFNTDQELLDSLKAFYEFANIDGNSIKNEIKSLQHFVEGITTFDKTGVYISCESINDISNYVYGSWSVVTKAINDDYDKKYPNINKETEKYKKNKENYLKSINFYSIEEIEKMVAENSNIEKNIDLLEQIKERIANKISAHCEAYKTISDLINLPYQSNKKLIKDSCSISKIKVFLDSINDLYHELRIYINDNLPENNDYFFYSELRNAVNVLKEITPIYNKTRNYLTKKPYSDEKIRLTFDNPQLLDGWDINKEKDYLSTILLKDNRYYLAIIDKKKKDVLLNAPISESDYYQKMVYKQIPSCAKYYSSKQINPTNPPENIKKYLDTSSFKKESMTKDQLVELIRYIVEDFIVNYGKLKDKNNKPYFNYHFKAYEDYRSWNEFCKELDKQSYSIKFENISSKYIDELVQNGNIYLFEIYNKDMSKYSKGNKNLHTMYFEALFDKNNLENVVYQLNGGGEMFYRKSSLSLSDTTIHKANQPIRNKNELSIKKDSEFNYDIIKDKRYTESQFYLHIPITINSNEEDQKSIRLNDLIRQEIKEDDDNKIIGIDRGERNLIYISVIDSFGNIIEQKSFNIIENEYKNAKYPVDYHKKLDEREKERDLARKEWKTIETIKELKDGYISAVVHEIVLMAEKYNAIIALEDLNSKFLKSRTKVEKSVYQKFENMLVDKLGYLIFKNRGKNELGGLYRGYQLARKNEVNSKQNGILFYIPAWLTSKIDPTTGFSDLLKPKYTSVAEAKKLFSKIDDIRFNESDDLFEFDINYEEFERTNADYRKKWTICTNGSRIKNFRDPENNNKWTSKEVNLTKEFKELFEKYNITLNNELKEQILSQKDNAKDFYQTLIGLLALTLQMRNSVINTDIDYLISPVRNKNGVFFDSNKKRSDEDIKLPLDADANGAYHIALKALWAINQIKSSKTGELNKVKLTISNEEWLKFAQTRN